MKFFAIVLALGVPFWLLGALTGGRLPANLPISALGFICPLLAAMICVRADGGSVLALLRRVFDHARITSKLWYLPLLLLMPALTVTSYWLMLLAGRPLPKPHISLLTVLLYCVVYLIAAACEEIGWTGYATEPAVQRWGPTLAGLGIGAVWAAWHVLPWLEVRDLTWTVWQFVLTVAVRTVLVWIYTAGGRSLMAAIVFHASINVSYSLFPNGGSHYDPAFLAPLVTLLAALVITRQVAQSVQRNPLGKGETCDVV